jgi:hypothetical protein
MKTKAKEIGCILRVVCAVFFLFGCSFNPEMTKETESKYNDVSVRENLALLKASGNFTIDEEYLTSWVIMLLNSDKDERSTASGTTVITGSRKLPVSEERVANRSVHARSAAIDEPPVDVYVFDTENTGSGSSGYVIASNDLRLGVLLAIIENGSIEDEPELFTDIIFAGIANIIDYTVEEYNSISEEEIQKALEDSASRGAATATTGGATYTDSNKDSQTGSGKWTTTDGKGLLHHYYPDEGNVTSAGWEWREGYYSTIPVLWHQEAPYNYVVIRRKGGSSIDDYVTGCGPTAVAQLMAFHRKPTKSTYLLNPYSSLTMNGYTYHWDDMIKGEGSSSNPPTGGFKDVAVLMYEIGRRAAADYKKKDGSKAALTSTGPIGVLTALHAMGYKTPAAFTGYDFSTVKSSVKNNKPVIALGYSNPDKINGGHYWLIDGVRKMTYKETVEKDGKYFTWTWQETDWVRCNTGWGEPRTAWYISEIFDFRNNMDSWAQAATISNYYQYGLRMLPNVGKK